MLVIRGSAPTLYHLSYCETHFISICCCLSACLSACKSISILTCVCIVMSILWSTLCFTDVNRLCYSYRDSGYAARLLKIRICTTWMIDYVRYQQCEDRSLLRLRCGRDESTKMNSFLYEHEFDSGYVCDEKVSCISLGDHRTYRSPDVCICLA